MKSEIGGESMECYPEKGVIVYQPRGETIYCDSIDAFMFQIGMVMMFCIDIVALPKSLPSNLKPLLPHGL